MHKNIILMLSFFIILSSFSTINARKENTLSINDLSPDPLIIRVAVVKSAFLTKGASVG